jgi:hypothetical protein
MMQAEVARLRTSYGWQADLPVHFVTPSNTTARSPDAEGQPSRRALQERHRAKLSLLLYGTSPDAAKRSMIRSEELRRPAVAPVQPDDRIPRQDH